MNRVQELASVTELREVTNGIFEITLRSPRIAHAARAGQFVNVKAIETMWGPFLRRPFSISRTAGDQIVLVFNVVGTGTRLLAARRKGDMLDIIGPLGQPFGVAGEYKTAIFVAGGLGIAPFPFLQKAAEVAGKHTKAYVGARSKGHVYTSGLKSVRVATDDGTDGFHGTVVGLLEDELIKERPEGVKIFGCGPTPMLKALREMAMRLKIPCELSLEGDMACGIGLCQGCPVERTVGGRKYALVCTEGPTFDCTEIVL